MAVKIRLARYGAKKKPFYRIVVSYNESPRDGKFLEKVGTYNPMINPAEVVFNEDRVKYWLEKGALPTVTVRNFLKKKNILFF